MRDHVRYIGNIKTTLMSYLGQLNAAHLIHKYIQVSISANVS